MHSFISNTFLAFGDQRVAISPAMCPLDHDDVSRTKKVLCVNYSICLHQTLPVSFVASSGGVS